ncbi:hypothetical protein AAY80_100 [Stenotrophomonas phage vB_SmaS-DLP_6]|nr:hypothetical protein AAY80_100 [Stenotrophomonas phage vB_SmaS-DLP_6]
MTLKKDRRVDERERDKHHSRQQEHLADKHYRNAFRSRSFSTSSLTEEDLDDLGFDEDERY